MLIPVLQSKLHRVTVTESRLDYEGSLTIDGALMDLAGLAEFQQIQVYNVASGHRFETYTIRGEANSGIIQVNGAAAHLAKKGDLLIVAAYGLVPQEQAADHVPRMVFVDRQNRPAPKPDLMPV